jgi:hypothetical protein
MILGWSGGGRLMISFLDVVREKEVLFVAIVAKASRGR